MSEARDDQMGSRSSTKRKRDQSKEGRIICDHCRRTHKKCTFNGTEYFGTVKPETCDQCQHHGLNCDEMVLKVPKTPKTPKTPKSPANVARTFSLPANSNSDAWLSMQQRQQRPSSQIPGTGSWQLTTTSVADSRIRSTAHSEYENLQAIIVNSECHLWMDQMLVNGLMQNQAKRAISFLKCTVEKTSIDHCYIRLREARDLEEAMKTESRGLQAKSQQLSRKFGHEFFELVSSVWFDADFVLQQLWDRIKGSSRLREDLDRCISDQLGTEDSSVPEFIGKTIERGMPAHCLSDANLDELCLFYHRIAGKILQRRRKYDSCISPTRQSLSCSAACLAYQEGDSQAAIHILKVSGCALETDLYSRTLLHHAVDEGMRKQLMTSFEYAKYSWKTLPQIASVSV